MSDSDKTKETHQETHFGFKDVSWDQKQGLVNQVFDSVAENYDLMNDLMSGGLHRLWKRFVIDMAKAKPGDQILDLAGGTGDLAQAFIPQILNSNSKNHKNINHKNGQVVLADINFHMLSEGQKRLDSKGLFQGISLCQLNAESLPFPDAYFDLITMGFGLRNVRDKDLALKEICRVLKPTGKVFILEFSKPTQPLFSKIYDFYSFKILPKIGKLIAKDEDSYRYLAESIRKHPDQVQLQNKMLEAGFSQVDFHNLTGGIVAVHVGQKIGSNS